MPKTQPIPEGSPEPKEISDFRAKYGEALEHAKISAEHTATQGWQDLYGAHIEKMQKGRAELADRLRGLAESLPLRFLTEDEEKFLAETKKEISELRESDESFRASTIGPVIAPMQECATIIEESRSLARNAERETPLHTRGLLEAMETVIDTMPRVKFLTASGKLTVG